jgi:hypothetical protein
MIADSQTEYPAVCYDFVCPYCANKPIEIYIDRIITENELWIAGDGEEAFVSYLTYKIRRLVLHELFHWAGCDEEEAQLMDELSDELAAEYIEDSQEG